MIGSHCVKLIEERPHLILGGQQFRQRSVREEQVYQRPVQCRKLARDFCPPQSRHRTNAIGNAAPDCTPVRVGRQDEALRRAHPRQRKYAIVPMLLREGAERVLAWLS